MLGDTIPQLKFLKIWRKQQFPTRKIEIFQIVTFNFKNVDVFFINHLVLIT